jgi:hypothetical protein
MNLVFERVDAPVLFLLAILVLVGRLVSWL